jgi:hypothetical protein
MDRQPLPPQPAAVAIATCGAVAGVEREDLQVIEALSRRGINAVHAVWNDPAVDWSLFPLVVIRSTWDYPDLHREFLAWADQLRSVLNPLPILRWNTNKRYLGDLAGAELPVIPTHFLGPEDVFEPPSSSFVVKPAVSCGAKDTARYDATSIAKARDHVRRLQASGCTVLVQPYLAAVEAKGEVAIMFIGGAYSHSIRRGALLNDIGLPEDGQIMPLNVQTYEATPEERSLAEKVMLHIPGDPADLLYGRVDLVPGPNGKAMILEVELTEPTLFLEFSNGGVERLADRIASAFPSA